jgi:alpha-tubulin suppressor-like RCC1 family protein
MKKWFATPECCAGPGPGLGKLQTPNSKLQRRSKLQAHDISSPFDDGLKCLGIWAFRPVLSLLLLLAGASINCFGQCCAPVITMQPQSVTTNYGATVSFNVGVSSGTLVTYQWRLNGVNIAGATATNYIIASVQLSNAGNYSVALTNSAGGVISSNALLSLVSVVGWGATNADQTVIPNGLTNVVAIAAGGGHSMALQSNGTIVAWGSNTYGQTNVPPGLSNVVAISGGEDHSVALRSNGAVVVWGDNSYDQGSVPVNLSNVVRIGAGGWHSIAVRSNGTIVAWGANLFGQTNVPLGLSDVVAVAAGGYHSLALRSDGTLVGWGDNYYNQANIPADLSNVVAIAAGTDHNLALKSDGTVTAWGGNYFGQADVPPGLTNVAAITAGRGHSLALMRNGALVAWGDNSFGQTNLPSDIANVIAISSRGDYSLALLNNGAPVITVQPVSRKVAVGNNVTFNFLAVGNFPRTYQWRRNGVNIGATNTSLTLMNVQPSNAGVYSVVVSNSLGAATSAPATLTVIAPPILTALGFSNNTFRILMSSSAGTFVLDASQDLTGWLPIRTNTVPGGTFIFTDSAASAFSHRFYRARQ